MKQIIGGYPTDEDDEQFEDFEAVKQKIREGTPSPRKVFGRPEASRFSIARSGMPDMSMRKRR